MRYSSYIEKYVKQSPKLNQYINDMITNSENQLEHWRMAGIKAAFNSDFTSILGYNALKVFRRDFCLENSTYINSFNFLNEDGNLYLVAIWDMVYDYLIATYEIETINFNFDTYDMNDEGK